MILQPHVKARELLRQWRESIGLSQASFASLMGVPLRTYEDIETGRSRVRPVHVSAAAMAMLEHAAENGGWRRLPEELRQIAQRAVADR